MKRMISWIRIVCACILVLSLLGCSGSCAKKAEETVAPASAVPENESGTTTEEEVITLNPDDGTETQPTNPEDTEAPEETEAPAETEAPEATSDPLEIEIPIEDETEPTATASSDTTATPKPAQTEKPSEKPTETPDANASPTPTPDNGPIELPSFP